MPPGLKAEARGLVRDAIVTAGKGAAEVFVRVNKEFLEADVAASVWPGLAGIVLPKVECPEDVVGGVGGSQLRGTQAGDRAWDIAVNTAFGIGQRRVAGPRDHHRRSAGVASGLGRERPFGQLGESVRWPNMTHTFLLEAAWLLKPPPRGSNLSASPTPRHSTDLVVR